MANEASDIVALYRLIQSVVSTMPEAGDDVVHDTWERILRHQFGTRPLSVVLPHSLSRFFVVRAVQWTLRDGFRKDKRRSTRERGSTQEVFFESCIVDRIDAVQRLRKVWQTLNSEEREILTLLFVDGHSNEAVAKRYNISQEALRQRLRRCRLRAQKVLSLAKD